MSTTEEIVHNLQIKLKDEDYRRGWEANIAMSFIDEYKRHADNINMIDIRTVANNAAKNFIDTLLL